MGRDRRFRVLVVVGLGVVWFQLWLAGCAVARERLRAKFAADGIRLGSRPLGVAGGDYHLHPDGAALCRCSFPDGPSAHQLIEQAPSVPPWDWSGEEWLFLVRFRPFR